MERDAVEMAHVIASLAHDLRSPLHAVIGFSHLLLEGMDGPLSEMQAADVRAIHASGDLLLRMIDCLIDLSRAQVGWLVPSPTAVHLDALLEKVVALHTGVARESGVRVAYAVQDLPHLLWGDGALLEKGMERLLEGMTRLIGSGTIELSAQVTDVCAAVQLDARSTSALSPDALNALEAYRTGGTSAEHRVDPGALCLIASQQLLALNGATLELGKPSPTEVRASMSFPLATSRAGPKLDP